jgi:hypothetical protein
MLHLTRPRRLWTFQLLGFEVFQVRLQKKNTSTVYRETQRRDFRSLEDKLLFSEYKLLKCNMYLNFCLRNSLFRNLFDLDIEAKD